MTNHTTRTRKHNSKIWSLEDKQWLLGHAQLFPLFGRSDPLLIPCHGTAKDCMGRAAPGDVACHIAPNRIMLSKRGPAFNYWGILSFLWVFHRLYSNKSCFSSCSWVHSHLPRQAQHAGQTDGQPCAEPAPAPSTLPTPQHCSSAAKFSVATPDSCNINTFLWLMHALHVLQMLQQRLQVLQLLQASPCQQAGEPTSSDDSTLWPCVQELAAPWGLPKIKSDLIKYLGS